MFKNLSVTLYKRKREKEMVKKRIVVVDDDDSIRKTFFMILHENYHVYLAKNSFEALQRFKDTKVDLIISDLKLPGIDGIEMIRHFRKAGYPGEVIMISAYPDLVTTEELKRLSISRFFVKPLDLNALTQSIDYLLHSKNENLERL